MNAMHGLEQQHTSLLSQGCLRASPQALKHVNIPNFLIVAIDTKLRDYLTEKGVNVYYKDIQARQVVSGGDGMVFSQAPVPVCKRRACLPTSQSHKRQCKRATGWADCAVDGKLSCDRE